MPRQVSVPTTHIRIGNDTASALVRGEVLELDETLTHADYWLSNWPPFLKGVKPTKGNASIAILNEPCAAKSGTDITIANAQVAGICMVKVNVGATWHRRARPVKDSHVLTSGLFGPCEILSELTATGEQLALCSIGHSANRGMVVKTTSAITVATLTSGRLTLGSGTAKVCTPYSTATQYEMQNQEATIYNQAGDEISSGVFLTVTPTDDWLPLATIESCTEPT